MATPCANCGSELLVPGRLSTADPLVFIPSNPKFLASGSRIHITVSACAMCGHVQMSADTEELASKAEPPEAPEPPAPGSSATPKSKE